MTRQITAFSNPLIKQVRGLREKKNRRAEGLFLAEGLRILTEAREAGRLPEVLLFASGHRHPLLDALIEATASTGGDVVETTADIIGKVTAKDNPQTVIGAYRMFGGGLDELDRGAAEGRACRSSMSADMPTPSPSRKREGGKVKTAALSPVRWPCSCPARWRASP